MAAVRGGATRPACMLHAHLAYLHWSTPPGALTRRSARRPSRRILGNHPFYDAEDGSTGRASHHSTFQLST